MLSFVRPDYLGSFAEFNKKRVPQPAFSFRLLTRTVFCRFSIFFLSLCRFIKKIDAGRQPDANLAQRRAMKRMVSVLWDMCDDMVVRA